MRVVCANTITPAESSPGAEPWCGSDRISLAGIVSSRAGCICATDRALCTEGEPRGAGRVLSMQVCSLPHPNSTGNRGWGSSSRGRGWCRPWLGVDPGLLWSTNPHQALGSLLAATVAATSTVLHGGILQRASRSPLVQSQEYRQRAHGSKASIDLVQDPAALRFVWGEQISPSRKQQQDEQINSSSDYTCGFPQLPLHPLIVKP